MVKDTEHKSIGSLTPMQDASLSLTGLLSLTIGEDAPTSYGKRGQEDKDGRRGWGAKRQVREEKQVGRSKTKGSLKGYMETKGSRSFLKHLHG